jgi:hypothetical protein
MLQLFYTHDLAYYVLKNQINYTLSLRVERSETKQPQGLGLLRFARNDGKYFCSPTYIPR